jgi:hypothetical protein
VRVVYSPLQPDTWELFVRDDGDSSIFNDPSSLNSSHSQGTAIDNTYETSDLQYIGCYFNHGGSQDETIFDNISIPKAATSSTTYTWQATSGTADFTTASNWSPDRNSIANTDVLQFNQGGTSTATNVPNETVGQIKVSNSTTINLQAASGSDKTLTVQGTTNGDDVTVDGTSSLNIVSDEELLITLGSGATASISGDMTMSSSGSQSPAHRFSAADASAITFNNGSTFTAENLGGNPFDDVVAGSVIFASGSEFVQNDGSSPFGNNDVAVFNSGSTFTYNLHTSPSIAGKTFGI